MSYMFFFENFYVYSFFTLKKKINCEIIWSALVHHDHLYYSFAVLCVFAWHDMQATKQKCNVFHGDDNDLILLLLLVVHGVRSQKANCVHAQCWMVCEQKGCLYSVIFVSSVKCQSLDVSSCSFFMANIALESVVTEQ